jgi:cytochrome c oxidase cbb3-type subunit 3
MRTIVTASLIVTAALIATSCQREKREFPQTASLSQSVAVTELHPGGGTPPSPPHTADEGNAYSLSEAKNLYSAYNCTGCHANGGGAIGPPLMDDEWIYGSDPENIFETIVEGRPNGMPAFRGKLSNQQVWQLVGYVRSLGGLVRSDVAGGRDDHMQKSAQEQSTTKQAPKQAFQPPASTHP